MIPQVEEDRQKCLDIVAQRNPQGYANCRGCGDFVCVSVGGGTLMYFCESHGLKGTVAG